VLGVAVSPDGGSIVAGTADGSVRLWDAQERRERLPLQARGAAVTVVAFSPDGKQIAAGAADKILRVWDAATGRSLYHLDMPATALAFSPDGRSLATGSTSGAV